MKVDIIIPLYNEEAILADSIDKLIYFLDNSSFPYEHTITLVDNASDDRSWDICGDLSGRYQKVNHLRLEAKGKGLAVRTAWSSSNADIVVFMDVDLSSDLTFLEPLVRSIVDERYDMAVGNRLGSRSTVISKKFVRKIASWFYNMFVRIMIGSSLDDHQCGFKAMKKSSFDSISPLLQENGWIFDTELIAVSIQSGMKISSVDIIWSDRGDSKVSLFKDSIKMFMDVIKLKRRLSKNRSI